uniref:F-box only protein 7 n=1 Tax=Centroberyx gerrardi TaxID=166262 RepID=UPI003AAD70C0
MKLRVRINKQTSRVELLGEEPTLTDLKVHIKETVLSSHGLSPDTEFSLSLNGTEPLSDAGQTLSSCGIISGDLICVMLPQSVAAASPSSAHQASSSTATQRQEQSQSRQTAAMSSTEQSASNPAASRESEGNDEAENQGAEVSSWEPMLCSEAEEGQAPLSLELLYHGAQSRSPSDTLMVAVNCLMLETGFTPQGSEMKPGEMPSGWRAAGGLYKLHYTHPLCDNSLAMVVAVTMGPMLVINGILKMNETADPVRKLSLNPSSYVTDEFQGESAAAAFKDLSKLSRIFKDQLAYPLIAAAREAMALPAVFGLGALPPELLLRVLRLLDVQSLVTLSSVSRHFHSTTADSTLWRHLYHRDFRDPSRSRDTDWKELYKRKYKIRIDCRRMSRPYLVPPIYPIPSNPFNPFNPDPFPPYPPGIIGGEYDQRPNIPHGLLPRTRYDPIGPPLGGDPTGGGLIGRRGHRPTGSRPADIRRGFI